MKNIRIILILAVCVTLFSGQAIASLKENLKGTWEMKVPAAPYEFSTGKVIFGEAEGQSTVVVEFPGGAKLKGQNVKIENDTFSFSVIIEYETVKVTGKLVEGKLIGKADTPEGQMDFSAVKKQEKAG